MHDHRLVLARDEGVSLTFAFGFDLVLFIGMWSYVHVTGATAGRAEREEGMSRFRQPIDFQFAVPISQFATSDSRLSTPYA